MLRGRGQSVIKVQTKLLWASSNERPVNEDQETVRRLVVSS